MSVAVGAGRTAGVLLITSAGLHAVTHGRVTVVPQRQHLVLAVVVIVVPAFMAEMRPAVSMMLCLFLPLPHFLLPLHPFPFLPVHALEQTAGNEGDGQEQDYDRAHN